MKRFLLFLVCLFVLFSFAACEEKKLSAKDYVDAFVDAGLPVSKIFAYDDKSLTDRITRKGCISVAEFADNRLEQSGTVSFVGGTVEVYKSKSDLKTRVDLFDAAYEIISTSSRLHIYTSADGLALLLLDSDLTDEQAQEYAEVFQSLDASDLS